MPAVIPSLGLTAGVLLVLSIPQAVWGAILAGAMCVTALGLRRVYSAATLGAVAAGMSVAWGALPVIPDAALTDTRGEFDGTVIEVREGDGTTRIIARGRFTGTEAALSQNDLCIIFQTPSPLTPVARGDRFKAQGKFMLLEDLPDLPFSPDRGAYLKAQGVTATLGVVYDYRTVGANGRQSWVEEMRRGWQNAIRSAGFDDATTAFLLTTLAGESGAIDYALQDRFKATGLAHTLAISGLHLAIIVWVMSWVLYVLRFSRRTRMFFYVGVTLFAAWFAVLAGGGPAVCRAAVMVGVFMLGRIFEARPGPYNSLSVTVIVWLLINPLWIYSPGFIMSVLATLSVVYFSDKLNVIPARHMWWRRLSGLVVTPVAAMLGIGLLNCLYFNSLPLWFLPANILAALAVPVLLVLGLCGAVMALAGIKAGIVAWCADKVYHLFQTGIESLGEDRLWIEPGGIDMVLWALALVTIVIFLNRRTALRGALCLGMIAVCVAWIATSGTAVKGPELYVPAGGSTAALLYCDKDSAMAYVDDRAANPAAVAKGLSHRYGCYLDSRGHRDFAMREWHPGQTLILDGKRIRLIGAVNGEDNDDRADILIVTGQFDGDIARCASCSRARLVIIAGNVHHKRAAQYALALRRAGIECTVQDGAVKL